jgi:hypothetical protein
MRAHADHGRRGSRGRGGRRAPRATRLAIVLAGGLSALALAPALAATVKPVTVTDPSGDAVTDAPDLTRVQLGRASDGRLRAVLSLRDEWVAKDLLADEGPPGSLCVRLWTLTKPVGIPPDYLVCVSATADGKLRATVTQEQVNADPKRIASAAVSRPSTHSVTIRFSQTSVGRPKTIRFAGEVTKAGCARTSCVDTAPDAPKTATLKLG